MAVVSVQPVVAAEPDEPPGILDDTTVARNGQSDIVLHIPKGYVLVLSAEQRACSENNERTQLSDEGPFRKE